MTWARTGSLAARIALAALALLAAAVVSHPLWLAPLLARHLAASAGRSVHFDSVRVGLTPSLQPVVRLRGVRIANAPWAEDPQAPFAALDEAVFVFAWLPFEGRHVVRRMRMRGGVVNLERAADGLRNWRLADPQDRGPGHYWFYTLEAHGVTLGFINHRLDLRVSATETDVAAAAANAAAAAPRATAASGASADAAASSASAASAPAGEKTLPARIDFALRWRGVPAHGRVATGAVLSFLRSGRWFDVRGDADVAGATLAVDGRAADLFRGARVDTEATLAGTSLAALAPWIGARWPAPHEYRIQGHVTRDAAGRYGIDRAVAQVGRSDFEGQLSWARGHGRQDVTAKLHSRRADAQDLRWLAGQQREARPGDGRAAADEDAGRPAGDAFAALRTLDADVDLGIDRLRLPVLREVEGLRVAARLAAGQLTTSTLALGWAGGRGSGHVTLDLRQPEARAEAALDMSGVRLASVLPAARAHALSGIVSGHAALHSHGATPQALRRDVAGTIDLHLRDGTVSSLLDAELGLEGGKLLRSLVSGDDALPLPCAAARLDLAAGRARVRRLVVDSANTRVTGEGDIDLRGDRIDLLLTPQPRRPGPFDLHRSIRVFGPWHKLQKKLVPRVAVAADPGQCHE